LKPSEVLFGADAKRHRGPSLKAVLRRNEGCRKALPQRRGYNAVSEPGITMTSTHAASASAVESSDVWQAVHHLGLCSWSEAELEALIARHRAGPLAFDRVAAEAVRLVRNLRREAAAGTFL
jgi:hypothetical protein